MGTKATFDMLVAGFIFVAAIAVWNRYAKAPQGVKFISGPSPENYLLISRLLGEKKPLLISGVSLLDNGKRQVRVVCFLQSTRKNGNGRLSGLRGWSYFIDRHPSFKEGVFYHFDTNIGENTVLSMPTHIAHMVSEVDQELLQPGADIARLQEAADYAARFIHQ